MDESVFVNSWVLYGILFAALLFSIGITFFIAQRIGKAISEKYKRWVYLVVSLIPLKELFEMLTHGRFVLTNPYFWFWLLFWLFCLFMFLKLRGQRLREERETS